MPEGNCSRSWENKRTIRAGIPALGRQSSDKINESSSYCLGGGGALENSNSKGSAGGQGLGMGLGRTC